MFSNGHLEPCQVLEEFYKRHGIREDDLDGKLRVMSEVVIIPDFLYETPSLYELEEQFLKERGFRI